MIGNTKVKQFVNDDVVLEVKRFLEDIRAETERSLGGT
jgi:hypothetical protein